MNQVQLVRFLAHRDDVARRTGEVVLTVAGNLRVDLHVRRNHDLQLAVAIDHDRPTRQRMWVHRHDHDRVKPRMHDRAAGRQRVCGRAGGRCDNQAIGLLRADELAVDVQLELDHAGGLARVQHHVVQRVPCPDRLFVASRMRFEEEAVLQRVLAVEDLGDLFLQLVRPDIGQKAQAAAVDPQHRHTVLGHGTRRTEQAAVAADHDDQIAGFTETLA